MPEDINNYPNLVKHAWKPGQSGNPKGSKPRRRILTNKLIKFLDKLAEDVPAIKGIASTLELDPETATVADVVMMNMVVQSMLSGNSSFIIELLNRVEGKVADRIVAEVNMMEDMSDEELDEIINEGGDEVDSSTPSKSPEEETPS